MENAHAIPENSSFNIKSEWDSVLEEEIVS